MADEPSDQRIAALQAELADLRVEVQEFAATVAHDLRAPLRHILSYAQLVQEDAGPQLSAEVQEFLATMTQSARHMGVLLDGLSALARVGSAPLALGPVSLQEAVQHACDGLSRCHAYPALEWQVAGDLPVVHADTALLQQVLEQVLGNAGKFTAPRARARVVVRATPSEDDRHTRLQVQDNGVGYNPAMQAKLFQVFGRLHSAQQFDGIGMGLVLSRKILQRMGGSIAIDGVVDGGCSVTLTLPLFPD